MSSRARRPRPARRPRRWARSRGLVLGLSCFRRARIRISTRVRACGRMFRTTVHSRLATLVPTSATGARYAGTSSCSGVSAVAAAESAIAPVSRARRWFARQSALFSRSRSSMYRLNEGATASCMRADAASEDSAASALTTARKWLQCSSVGALAQRHAAVELVARLRTDQGALGVELIEEPRVGQSLERGPGALGVELRHVMRVVLAERPAVRQRDDQRQPGLGMAAQLLERSGGVVPGARGPRAARSRRSRR